MNRFFSLQKMFIDIKLTINMLIDYTKGNYKDIPLDTLSALFLMTIYIISPIDVISDLIPIIGWMDDLAIVRFVLIYAQKDLKKYSEWKEKKDTFTA